MYLERFLIHFSFPLTNVFVCVLTTSKLLLLQCPQRTRSWAEKEAHLVCVICWILAAFYSGLKLLHYKHNVYFNYATYDIDYNSTAVGDNKLFTTVSDSIYAIMVVIVMVTTAFTLRFLFEARSVARRAKSGTTMRWQGLLTVVLTALVYCVSTIPWTVHGIAEAFLTDPPDYFNTTLKRAAEYLTMLSVISNFYIYCVTVPSFRSFVLSPFVAISTSISPSQSQDVSQGT